jgi:hypothetical protein
MDAQQQDAPQNRLLTDQAVGATTVVVSGDLSRATAVSGEGA